LCLITKDNAPVSTDVVTKLRSRMQEIIDADKPIRQISTPTTHAIKLFTERGLDSIANILKYRKNFYTTYFSLGDTVDFFIGTLVPSTGYLKKFNLQPYYDGILLQGSADITLMPKLYQTYKNNWSLERKARLTNIADLNSINIYQQRILIKISEALHEKNVVRIAD
ncbi:MAG: hypothetical protein IKS58_05155, partial [Paludibacteraceae bacterium]|nr:hypothetical protein [Paludibacteraceae bacterium]